jgi:hypothetical protein
MAHPPRNPLVAWEVWSLLLRLRFRIVSTLNANVFPGSKVLLPIRHNIVRSPCANSLEHVISGRMLAKTSVDEADMLKRIRNLFKVIGAFAASC